MDENGSEETDIFEMEPEPQPCAGITAEFLRTEGWVNKQIQGFRHEVAASLRNKATIISQTKEWEFDSSVDGILHDGNTGKVNYVIEEIAHDTPVPSDENIDYFIVRSSKCTVLSNELVTRMNGALCQCCNRRLRNLRDRCNAAVNNRNKEEGSKGLLNTRHSVTDASPSLVHAKYQPVMKDRRAEQKRKSYEKLKKKLIDDEGIDVDINDEVSKLFSTDSEEAQQKFVFNGRHKNLQKLSWMRHGSLSFDAMKIKDGLVFDFNSGILVGYAKDAFDKNVILSELQNHITKCCIPNEAPETVQEENGAAATGAAAEADSASPPAATTGAATEANSASPPTSDASGPDLAGHYLVFYFQTWDSRTKAKFLAARYAMGSLGSEFLVTDIPKIIAGLWKYGFIVDTVVGDGASENRSTFKQLAEFTANDLF
eukprot:scaffold133194_cov43-Attheya_sp.AAC.1